jgi:hypothetical protein
MPSAQPVPAQLNNMTQLTLSELTLDEVNAVLIALQELPAKICNPLSDKIRTQAKTQIDAYEAQNSTGRVIQHNLAEGIDTVDKLG